MRSDVISTTQRSCVLQLNWNLWTARVFGVGSFYKWWFSRVGQNMIHSLATSACFVLVFLLSPAIVIQNAHTCTGTDCKKRQKTHCIPKTGTQVVKHKGIDEIDKNTQNLTSCLVIFMPYLRFRLVSLRLALIGCPHVLCWLGVTMCCVYWVLCWPMLCPELIMCLVFRDNCMSGVQCLMGF